MSGADVHVVIVPGDERPDEVHVFGHREDAEAYRDAVMLHSTAEAILSEEEILDSADARIMIEQAAAL